jgi:large subunit ribosomal protein L4
MKVEVITLSNKKVGEVLLSEAIFGEKPRQDVLHRVVEWQRAKSRAGTHNTKTIGEISGTTKKMSKQKGGGKARHGSARAGQFRKGAVLLGPKFRDHEYSIQKKIKTLALKMALSLRLKEKKLIILEDLAIDSHKTQGLHKNLSAMKVSSGLIVGLNKHKDLNFMQASRNIKHINSLPTMGINVLDILKHEHLFLTKESVEQINERLGESDGK